MWAGFEYGFNTTFRSACCGVYVEVDMKKWFGVWFYEKILFYLSNYLITMYIIYNIIFRVAKIISLYIKLLIICIFIKNLIFIF